VKLVQMPAHVSPAVAEPTWRGAARCRRDNANNFFSPGHFERKDEKDLREGRARAICRACPVQQACLEYALAVQEPHGIWGGLNELERRRTLRKLAAEGEQRTA
jgi:WhiB family redox-sensing transcriptional regulator